MTAAPARTLALTIDLAAEIRNITEKQHLNDVHYAVQLVRHALRHRAPAVHLRSTRTHFVVEHEGAPLDPDERDLLFTLLSGAAPEERQAAMSELESRHGVALLSLLLSHDEVRVESDCSFSVQHGSIVRERGRRPRGYRVVLSRRRRSRAAERREIAFYCRCSDVPVTLNGRALPRSPLGEASGDALLPMELETDTGRGAVALPRRGTMSRTRYYKHGIYFGVRQHVPSDLLPLESAYNARTAGFEDNFRTSVKAAGAAVRAGREALLAYLPGQLRDLPPADRERVRSVLLGMAERRWTEALRNMPLFDTGSAPASLSLADLHERGERSGFVAWVPRGRGPKTGPRSRLPELDDGDLPHLERLLSVPLRRALQVPGLDRAGPALPSPRPRDAALPDEACPPPVRALVDALRAAGGEPRVEVTGSGVRSVSERPGGRVVRVPLSDPLLARCAKAYAERPERLDLIRAALTG